MRIYEVHPLQKKSDICYVTLLNNSCSYQPAKSCSNQNSPIHINLPIPCCKNFYQANKDVKSSSSPKLLGPKRKHLMKLMKPQNHTTDGVGPTPVCRNSMASTHRKLHRSGHKRLPTIAALTWRSKYRLLTSILAARGSDFLCCPFCPSFFMIFGQTSHLHLTYHKFSHQFKHNFSKYGLNLCIYWNIW